VIKWLVKLSTFFMFFKRFFQNPKKHDFLRFFEWLTTFSRTLHDVPCQRWLQDKRPHGQKATGQKATATHLRVYCPAHKCNINTSLPCLVFFTSCIHTYTHHTCSSRAEERKHKTMLCLILHPQRHLSLISTHQFKINNETED